MSFVVVLPTFGSPYIWTGLPIKKDAMLKTLKEVVQGPIEEFKNNTLTCMMIHPMFRDENKRWGIVNNLMKEKDIKIYVNEEGRYECSPNMATLLCSKLDKHGSINLGMLKSMPWNIRHPMFGDIAFVVPEKTLKKHCPNLSYMTLLDDEAYEPYDDEANNDMKEFVDKFNMEYIEGVGQIYLSKDIEA